MLAFNRINYKVQGFTLTSAIVNSKLPYKVVQTSHKRVCLIYVQLSCLRSCADSGLLQLLKIFEITT